MSKSTRKPSGPAYARDLEAKPNAEPNDRNVMECLTNQVEQVLTASSSKKSTDSGYARLHIIPLLPSN